MTSVSHQRVTIQMFGKNLLADFDALLLRHLTEPKGIECILGALDDESCSVFVELVSMCPDPTILGWFEDECKRVVEFLMCP